MAAMARNQRKPETTRGKKGWEGWGGQNRRTPRPKAPRTGRHRGPQTWGAQKTNEKPATTTTHTTTPAQRRLKTTRAPRPATGKGEAHRNARGRPVRPTRPGRARTCTHALDLGVESSDPKEKGSASTRNNPGAPAKHPVARRMVRDTIRVSEQVHTRQTSAAHATQDRCRREPSGTMPSRGAELVRHRQSPAPLPRQGPAAGAMSPVLGLPPRAPRSCPVNPGA